MDKQTSLMPDETRSEVLLRTTLQEHTSQLDLNTAWATVVERLPMENRGQHKEKGKVLPLRSGQRRWRTVPGMVVAVLLAVCLMGAGIAGASFVWGGWEGTLVNADQYQNIGQQQTANGVTITVTKVYADRGRTIIAYDLQGPANWLKRYHSINTGTGRLLSQYREEPREAYSTCTDLSHYRFPMHCIAFYAPFHPSTGVTSLTVNWNVTKLILYKPDVAGEDILYGNWHFQFSIPFHWQNHKPGNPYIGLPQPALKD